MQLVHAGGQVFVAPDMIFSRIGNFLGGAARAIAPIASVAAPFLPGAGAVAGIAGALGSLGGGGQKQQPLSRAGNVLSLLGVGQSLTGGSLLGQGAPRAPIWQMDPQAQKLYSSLVDRLQGDMDSIAKTGLTPLDKMQVGRLQHDVFGRQLGADSQRLYEQQTQRGIEGSHPAFQAHERLTRDADNRYWDSELALRNATRDRQLQLQGLSMGATGLGTGAASQGYQSAYDNWQQQQQNWQNNQAAWGQLASPVYERMGLV